MSRGKVLVSSASAAQGRELLRGDLPGQVEEVVCLRRGEQAFDRHGGVLLGVGKASVRPDSLTPYSVTRLAE